MKAVLRLALLGFSVALPSLEEYREAVADAVAAAPACTGAGDPPHKAPFCFSGNNTILGMEEGVKLKITKYAQDKGTLTLDATAVQPEHCDEHKFTKQNQSIDIDFSDCLPSTMKFTAKYCSDQDAVSLNINIAHLPVPGGIPVTLTLTAC